MKITLKQYEKLASAAEKLNAKEILIPKHLYKEDEIPSTLTLTTKENPKTQTGFIYKGIKKLEEK